MTKAIQRTEALCGSFAWKNSGALRGALVFRSLGEESLQGDSLMRSSCMSYTQLDSFVQILLQSDD